MSDKTSIEWTNTYHEDGSVTAGSTWNPIRGQNARHTCARISPGCDNCYAATMTRRGLMGTAPIDYGTGETPNDPARLDEKARLQPYSWKAPRKIFVCSMTDLFGTWVPVEWITKILDVMLIAKQHTYIILTKRPTRMRDILGGVALPPHIWVGTTIESDQYAWRADRLRQMNAAVKWISAEPLLSGLPSLNLTGIDWLVSGGESGHGARPMNPAWVRDLRDHCAASGTAFFHKQNGEYVEIGTNRLALPGSGFAIPEGERPVGQTKAYGFSDGPIVQRVGRKAAGRLLDGAEHSAFPAVAVGAAS